jgi:hypothetical protein
VFVYTSRTELLILIRGFRNWVRHVGVFPIPAFTWAALDRVLPVYLEEVRMRRIKPPTGDVTKETAVDKVWSKHYPTLVAFLADTSYDQADGGGTRQPGMYSMWASGGFWHIKLRDSDSGHVCFVAGLSIDEVFKAADAATADPGAGWKPDVAGGGKRKR